MQATIFEPIRWQEQASRVAVYNSDEELQVHYQVTVPKAFGTICKGRPVEELPRILTMLGPAHHIVSAAVLDRLFNVEPPEMALNMRQALLQTLVFSHHIRKLFFLISSVEDPFGDHGHSGMRRRPHPLPRQILDELMQCLSLSQEAAAIIGGRGEHPLIAMAGGVGRFVKYQCYDRLAEIGEACLSFALQLADAFRNNASGLAESLTGKSERVSVPMRTLAMRDENAGTVAVLGTDGKETDRFSPTDAFDRFETHRESWTYEPFSCLKGKDKNVFENGDSDGFYFVGPLARLNADIELSTPKAEEERQRLIESLGPFPHFSVTAAYHALVVELIQAAERSIELYAPEKLSGPSLRTIPSGIGSEAAGSIESPQGLIAHRYVVDERGIVTDIEILDAACQNNALRCRVVREAVKESLVRNHSPDRIKRDIETSLLPF
jgi:coenzyme F420-reducing hydrogenase alpha subunit